LVNRHEGKEAGGLTELLRAYSGKIVGLGSDRDLVKCFLALGD